MMMQNLGCLGMSFNAGVSFFKNFSLFGSGHTSDPSLIQFFFLTFSIFQILFWILL